MKTMGHRIRFLVMISSGLLWLTLSPLCAQQVPETGVDSLEIHTQQLAAERNTLAAMLNDGNTPEERRVVIQRLLDWNMRGLTIAEVKRMQTQPLPVAATTPPPPMNNLTEAEAAPPAMNVNFSGGPMLQNFSKGRDAETSSKAAASLGLVKTPQEMDNATRESEATLREAQNIRNQAGASALAQQQQDAASAASQQAAGGIDTVAGDSLIQSVQQGAQAAGQAIGGSTAGRMSGVVGQEASGGRAPVGGAVAGGVSAGGTAAGQAIFRGGCDTGGASTPAVTPAAGPAPAKGPMVAPVAADVDAISTEAFFKRTPTTAGRRYVPNSTLPGPRPYVPNTPTPGPRPAPDGLSQEAKTVRTEALTPARDRRLAQPQNRPEAEIFDGGKTAHVAAESMNWVQTCPLHGKFYGKGVLTGCPRCEKISAKPGSGYIR